MKVLFVCRRNNGRSQLARALYNLLTKSNDADSCGIEVDQPGQLLGDRSKQPGSEVDKVIAVIKEVGPDISKTPRRQFQINMLNDYDKVIVMLEPEMVPEYLKNQPNVEFWQMKDPKGEGIEGMRRGRDAIKARIEEVIARQ